MFVLLVIHFFSLAAGPHPRRVLTLTPRRGFLVRVAVWPQTLLFHWRRAPAVH